MSPTLRTGLRAVEPEHVALKRGWRRALQALRGRRRATGAVSRLRGQGDIARALEQPIASGPEVDATLRALKAALAVLARADTPETEAWAAAAVVDEAVCALVAAEAEAPVWVAVSGWPPGTPAAVCRAVVGHDLDAPLAPRDAARLVQRLDGLVLAGNALSVTVRLEPGTRLPAVPRGGRADRGRWGRGAAWLPHLDEEGRYSLTPEGIGRRRARRLGPSVVVDATAGCGGDSLSFAREGARVLAVEPDAGRRRHLEANAEALGLAERIRVMNGHAAEVAPRLLAAHPGALLFLDPPWGGPGAGLEGLARWLSSHEALLMDAPWVGLKLPRAFPVARLPPRPQGWRVQLELGEHERGDAQVVRMLTVVGGSARGQQATVGSRHRATGEGT